MTTAENDALYELFIESLAHHLGGPHATIRRGETALPEGYRQTRIIAQGDHGELQIAVGHPGEADDSRMFLALAKVCDQIFPDLRIQQEPRGEVAAGRVFCCSISDQNQEHGTLSCTFTGQFSQRELQGIHWFVLSRQYIEMRLVLRPEHSSRFVLGLQADTTGYTYCLHYTGRDAGGCALFRQEGVIRIEDAPPQGTLYFIGTISLAMTRFSDFLAGAELAIDLPDVGPAISAESTLPLASATIDRFGQFSISPFSVENEETFATYARDMKVERSVAARCNGLK